MKATEHIDDYVSDFVDGALSKDEVALVLAHTETCEQCSNMIRETRELLDVVSTLPTNISPDENLWQDIELSLAGDEASRESPSNSRPRLRRVVIASLSVAATLIVGIIAIIVATSIDRHDPLSDTWQISSVDGRLIIDNDTLSTTGSIRMGQTLRTTQTSQASIEVGSIGTVDVFPETTIQLLNTDVADHRFQLSQGGIHAVINAPPRLFFVETPSATAIDLGCEYSLEVDSSGTSRLHVQFGYVELSHPLRSSTIPEGYKAVSTLDGGPTVAIDEDASALFTDLLVNYSLRNQGDALVPLLDAATAIDATTLWLLIQNVTPKSTADNEMIYDRMVELAGEPPGVTRSGVVIGKDQEMVSAWQDFIGLDLTLMKFDVIKKKKRRTQ